MFPTLFSFGGFALSSFGVLLAFGFLFGIFLIWRLSRAWDLNEEKILDLSLLTILGGLIGARVYFILTHTAAFTSLSKILVFTKYPGFSFWGAFLGGWLTLSFFAKRSKLDFWMVADIAAVGFIGALVFADLGCFLGGCGVGVPTKSFFGVAMVGLIGKRWPIQLFEMFIFAITLKNIWSQATRFHQSGYIVSIALIVVGITKLILQPLRASGDDFVFAGVILALGITIFYKITKRVLLNDLKGIIHFCLTPKLILQTIKKGWYNQKIKIAWRFRNFKKFLRRINVRFTIKNSKIS